MSETRPPILTVAPTAYPGTTAVLQHYGVTGLTEHTDEISKETIANRKLIMFGGWHPIYHEALQKIYPYDIPTALFWTSSVGQIDFSNSGVEISFIHLIADLVESEALKYVILGTPQNFNLFTHIIPKKNLIYLPYAVDLDSIEKHVDKDLYPQDRWVDMFCPMDTRKNPLVQMHMAKLANANLHMSGMRPRYSDFAEMIRLNFTDMGWMQRPNYYRAVQTMKVGLQVTFAETFDYVVAEHFALERPCMISTVMCSWVKKELWNELLVFNLDDPLEGGDKLKRILDYGKEEWENLAGRCKEFIKTEADRRNDYAREVLGGLTK